MEKRIFRARMFITAVVLFSSITQSHAECSTYTRCDDCITQDVSCAWCDDIGILMLFGANSSSSRPAQLCGTPEELSEIGCRNIIDPMSTVVTENVPSPDSFLSLTSAVVDLRPGQTSSFDVTVSPPSSSPVDMYLLLDLSRTMQQNIQSLKNIAGDLVMRMQGLSSDFRIGFGSFIDKPVDPFTDNINNDGCVTDVEDTLMPADPAALCEYTYAYRHVLNFTANITALEIELNRTKIAASPDHPESVLDAMLQAAVCEEELNWRPRGQSQRIIVVFTDGDYHYALDGKIAGISSPSTFECLLDPSTHEYTSAHLFDYPSSRLISEALNERLITPIFTVSSGVQSVYTALANAIRSATVATLAANPVGILNLIENQYRMLSGTVVPILTPDLARTGISITVLPRDEDCGAGSLSPGSSDICQNINNINVTYTVQVSATPMACERAQPFQAQIQFIRFGALNVNISLQCGCECDAPPEVNSEVCNSRGLLECSTCVCNNEDQIGGALCDCPIIRNEVGCVDPQEDDGEVCNGQGTCRCGVCQCDEISEDSPLLFQGPYCANNPLNCPQSRSEQGNFVPCGGKGTCTGSRCECDDGYSGGACECRTNTSLCINPMDVALPEGTTDTPPVLCSGMGDCICGQCICNNYSQSFGQYCEECLPCRTSCSKVSPCLLCHLMPERECPQAQCRGELQLINDTMAIAETSGLKICSLREGSCEVRYYISSNIEGTENSVQIFMDSSQNSLTTLQQGSNQCTATVLIWPIFVGIIMGTIFIGILVIVLWRCFSYLGEYLEYRQWAKNSATDETDRSGDNPLFIDPMAQYSNPRYRPTTSS